MKNKKTTAIILILITILFAALGYVLLPDRVVTQILKGGVPGNTIPKFAAILAPVLLSAVGIGLYLGNDTRNTKHIILTITGFLLAAFNIIMNVWVFK